MCSPRTNLACPAGIRHHRRQVEACGEEAQNTFAIAVAGRGFDARISTEFDVGLPVGCNLDLHAQDNRIVKLTSPLDHDVGHGHLCVQGRFGFEFVQRRARE